MAAERQWSRSNIGYVLEPFISKSTQTGAAVLSFDLTAFLVVSYSSAVITKQATQ